jgi:hypothetical protein
VCNACGLVIVIDDLVVFKRMHGLVVLTPHATYRRIHHARGRISQLLIQELALPLAHLCAIGA